MSHERDPKVQAPAVAGESMQGLAWRVMAENSRDFLVLIDRDLKIAFVNRVDEGKSREDIIGRSALEFEPPECVEGRLRAYRRAFETGEGFRFRAEYSEVGGPTRIFDVDIKPVFEEEKVLWLASTATDVGAQRAEEVALRGFQKLEALETFVAGVAHEINNPLTGVINYAELIQTELPVDSPMREFSEGLVEEAERVAHIVSKLLTFAQKERGGRGKVDPLALLDSVSTLTAASFRRDGIRVSVRAPERLSPLSCSAQEIEQVLLNVLSNTRDSLNERFPKPCDEKRLVFEIAEFEHDRDRWLRFTVEDWGMGMSEKLQMRIFDPFFTTKAPGQATGLGLSVSKGIALSHGGHLKVESEKGHCRVSLELPCNSAESTHQRRSRSQGHSEGYQS